MRIGVAPNLDQDAGGVYQYSLMVVRALEGLSGEFSPVLVFDPDRRSDLAPWIQAGWEAVPLAPHAVRSAIRTLMAQVIGEARTARTAAYVRGVLGGTRTAPRGIDLMLFPSPTPFSYQCGLPFVMAIHDLQHRIHPEFPEVSANGEWEAREHLFSNAVRHAEAILVDSEVGREDVLEFYGHLTSPDRVRVLPFVVPPYLERPSPQVVDAQLRSLGVSGRFLLFPAQFWPHKNHRRLVEALIALHADGEDVKVVMTGAATGELRTKVLEDIRELVATGGIDELVQVLGYVDEAAIAALYAGSQGVLLPTFFGPTNIPVIEGWAMGVPVLTSDLRGIREQCGDAAILVDPTSVASIAEGVRRLWTDDALRERLVAAGTARLHSVEPADFQNRLASVLRDVGKALHARDSQGIPA